MVSKSSSLNEIKRLIKDCLNQLYDTDEFLFKRNKQRGTCERCLVFRFAHYLQDHFKKYFVDCDFNSSFEVYTDLQGNIIRQERTGKTILNYEDVKVTKRFIDIIVHKRDYNSQNDFLCFEIKKWNNTKASETRKDYNNLKKLTTDYGYKFGFHIVLNKTKNRTAKC